MESHEEKKLILQKKVPEHMENRGEKIVVADEIWFRENEKELLERRFISATVRAGDRTKETEDPKGGYYEGRFINVKIQKENKIFDEWKTEIVPYEVVKKKWREITEEDLRGIPLRTKSKTELAAKLKGFYGRDFGDEDVVTIVRFEHKENIKTVADLLRVKTLTLAKEPKDNPKTLEFPSYTIPLIEHDYPAKTPVMWNAVYSEFGIAEGNIMLIGNPKQCGHVLDALRKDQKYKGGGIGVGFKDEVIPYLDEVEPLAKEIGAVNFVLKTPEKKLKGFNTDGLGYAQSLEDAFKKRGEKLAGKKAVVLGAGGAGNAVAFALAEKGMKIVILNRTVEKAQELAEKINHYFNKIGDEAVRFGGEDLILQEVQNANAVINVSIKGSAGALEKYSALAPVRLPANEENARENLRQAAETLSNISKKAIISDIVLGKELTPLLKSAKDAEFEILDGIPMVINQGVEAFWLLYGKELKARDITKEKVACIMKNAAYSYIG